MAIVSNLSADDEYTRFKVEISKFRKWVVNTIARLESTDTPSQKILDGYAFLTTIQERITYYAGLTNFADRAKAAEQDNNYDIIAELAALGVEIIAVQTWIDNNFPASGGYLLYTELSGGYVTYRVFTPAQTAGLRGVLQVVLDRIDNT